MLLEILLAFVPWFILFCILWVGVTYIFQHKNYFSHVSSHSQQSFHNQHFSGKEIYAAVTAAVKERQIPGVSFSTAMHYQGGYFSEKREYLRIGRGGTMFLVCAAPFGTDYFISCWVGEPMSFGKDFIRRLPLIGPSIYKRMNERTFFQTDTESMFLGAVKHSVEHVVDTLKASKGIRPAAELNSKGTGGLTQAEDAAQHA